MDNLNNTQPAQQNTSPRRMHPLVATAAGAVIVASLAATAAVTGLFPKASSTDAQTNQTQAAQVSPGASQAVVDSAAPANPAAYAQQQAPRAPAPTQQPQQQYAAQQAPQYAQQRPTQPAYCQSCGTVEGISAVRQEGHGTGVGAVGGAVAGGVVGNQFGRGGGRTAMTILGALGGGLAGNSVEKHLRSTTSYSVRVRMENGHTRYFTYSSPPPFQQGQRVRVENGTIVAG